MAEETNYLERLGMRLSELRKRKGMIQEQIANEMGIPRSAYVQIEAGKRHVDTKELFKLSLILDFSIPELLGELFDSAMTTAGTAFAYEKKRMFNYQKFKSVILYILNVCRDRPNVGKVVLNKLLYYSDFNYYEKYKEYLTGLRYSKLPMGPVPGIEQFIEQMKMNMEIKEITVPYHSFTVIKYIAMVKPDMSVLTKNELEIIDSVLIAYSEMSATDISNLSHNDPPWLETPSIGDEIDYNLVFKRNNNYYKNDQERIT